HSAAGPRRARRAPRPQAACPPLGGGLRHGRPGLERLGGPDGPGERLAGSTPGDAVERLCLSNVVQQLDHLGAHPSVARAVKEGRLEVHGMYFDVAEAQAYLLTETDGTRVFDRVRAADLPGEGSLPV